MQGDSHCSDRPTVDEGGERIATSHVDLMPMPAPRCAALAGRLAVYVARFGLLNAAKNLGVSRPTLERALGGRRVIRAIERQLTELLDRDDRARSAIPATDEGTNR